ncbi:MAG TPA: hypothetical protein VEX40_09485 [Mycobacterium sp.]|nr:hypothetical protein [Mycobacterium sp.]
MAHVFVDDDAAVVRRQARRSGEPDVWAHAGRGECTAAEPAGAEEIEVGLAPA